MPNCPGFPITLAEWPKNQREVIRVELSEYRGQPLISARVWFHGDDDQLLPSKSGISISIKHLPQLAAGIAAALDRAIELGLVGALKEADQ